MKLIILFFGIFASLNSNAFFGAISMVEKIANSCPQKSNEFHAINKRINAGDFNENLSIDEVIKIVSIVEDDYSKWGQSCQERENSLYSFFGKNELNKKYVSTPISNG